jgi:ParB-like chromosome segregation protein Spo0J
MTPPWIACAAFASSAARFPVLTRSDGEVVNGHLRLKAAKKLGTTEVAVILCDEWTVAQVKAFRLMVNPSVSWAGWDEELLTLELDEHSAEVRRTQSSVRIAQI